MARRTVTVTDEEGRPQGEADLVEAHTLPGKLHRAFSVYVFRNGRKELLIQQRSPKKMLWPGIWANTCCSHPFSGEGAVDAGARRLREELGCCCPLAAAETFVYRAVDPEGRGVEHEHVTILVGDEDVKPVANPDEVMDWKWVTLEELRKDMQDHPDSYAPWFHLGLEKLFRPMP